jgi:hypothetical protein
MDFGGAGNGARDCSDDAFDADCSDDAGDDVDWNAARGGADFSAAYGGDWQRASIRPRYKLLLRVETI